MAVVLPSFSSRRVSAKRGLALRAEPAIGLRLLSLQNAIEPCESLELEYCVKRVSLEQIDRLELSIVWFTEGKGTEDIGVHHFESFTPEEISPDGLGQPVRLSTTLPAGPLSYEGKLFQIRWCVRLRLFLTNGREITNEQPFYLGHITKEV